MKKLLILSIGLLPCLVARFGYADDSWQRSFYWSGGPWGFGVGTCVMIPLLLMVAFWIAVVIGIVFFVKWVIAAGKRHETESVDSAVDILKKRYARGEISKEEFEKMRQDIQ